MIYIYIYGLTKEDYGKEFKYNNEKYILIGINTRAPKYPIIAKKVGCTTTLRFTKDIIKTII